MLRQNIYKLKVSDSGLREDTFVITVKANTREEAYRLVSLDGWILMEKSND